MSIGTGTLLFDREVENLPQYGTLSNLDFLIHANADISKLDGSIAFADADINYGRVFHKKVGLVKYCRAAYCAATVSSSGFKVYVGVGFNDETAPSLVQALTDCTVDQLVNEIELAVHALNYQGIAFCLWHFDEGKAQNKAIQKLTKVISKISEKMSVLICPGTLVQLRMLDNTLNENEEVLYDADGVEEDELEEIGHHKFVTMTEMDKRPATPKSVSTAQLEAVSPSRTVTETNKHETTGKKKVVPRIEDSEEEDDAVTPMPVKKKPVYKKCFYCGEDPPDHPGRDCPMKLDESIAPSESVSRMSEIPSPNGDILEAILDTLKTTPAHKVRAIASLLEIDIRKFKTKASNPGPSEQNQAPRVSQRKADGPSKKDPTMQKKRGGYRGGRGGRK